MRRALAVDQQIALHRSLLLIEVDDRRLEDAVLVGASGVDGEGLADPDRALALVDVAVERQQRLVRQDRVADGARADRDQRLAARHVVHVGVELRGVVEVRAVRRGVEVEDRPVRIGHLAHEPVDPLAQLGLGQLAEGVPRRRVGPAGRDQREAVERRSMLASPSSTVLGRAR